MSVPRVPRQVPARALRIAGLAAGGLGLAATLTAAAAPQVPGRPAMNQTGALYGVGFASPSDGWAVGVGNTAVGTSLALHWDGQDWKQAAAPNPGGRDGSELDGVATLSPSDAWAVGMFRSPRGYFRTLLVHWNGTDWTRVTSPTPGQSGSLNGVAALSASDVWAVGMATPPGKIEPLVLHWNGTTWKQVAIPHVGVELEGVTAVSPSDVWAVGYRGVSPSNPFSIRTMVLHWNGTSWKLVPSPSPSTGSLLSNVLYGVSASSASNAWAVGLYTRKSGHLTRTLALHWNGRTWKHVPSPSVGGRHGGALCGVTALSPTDAWAVGDDQGTDCVSDQAGQTMALHWNGTKWSRVATPPGGKYDSALYGASALSASNAWAVGINGYVDRIMLLHWNGRTWMHS